MEEIQVGEYVRTDNGKIYHFTDRTKKGRSIMLADNIVKHSFNIIDLIEVGDYVNEYKVEKKANGLIYVNYCWDCNLYAMVTKQIEDIKTIVTKEQFESMEYKLEE